MNEIPIETILDKIDKVFFTLVMLTALLPVEYGERMRVISVIVILLAWWAVHSIIKRGR